MKIYYDEVMSARKPCAVAKHLGLPVEYVRVDLSKGEHKQPDYLALNPNGRIATLVDGDYTLWEALAMMVYLAQRKDSDLWPQRDPARQVEVLRWLSWELCFWVPSAGTYYFEHLIKPMLGMGAVDEAALARTAPAFHEAAGVLDGHLAGRSYLVGEQLSIADFALGALLSLSAQIALPLAPHANLARYRDRLLKVDAIRAPFPS